MKKALSGEERDGKAVEMLRRGGLDESALRRFPHEFSGGQRQRMALCAR
jgi:ABC-type microcin C transport system duplicated ATPase subunit YejF